MFVTIMREKLLKIYNVEGDFMLVKKMKKKIMWYLKEKNRYIYRDYTNHFYKSENIVNDGILDKIIHLVILNLKYRVFRVGGMINNPYVANERLPYLKGAESSTHGKRKAQFFAKDLLEYDIISFDIFDTLILRPFEEPRDLFKLVEAEIDYLGFAELRFNIEQELREKKFNETDGASREVTIFEIYQELNRLTGIDIDFGIEMEHKIEMDMCYANPYMKAIFDILISNEKVMIAVSDMYFPEKYILRLLNKCGYSDLKKVYVSCDYNQSKREQGLYRIVEEEFVKGKNVVHIGDNYVSDYKMAEKFGWDSIYYRNVHVTGRVYRPSEMSGLIGSAYKGIVNCHLHNGLVSQYNPHYEYGFIYGGLFTLGYCNWIREYVEKNCIDKVLLLARDGYVLKKVFDKYIPEVNTEYVFWSRNPSRVLACEKYRYQFLKQYIFDRVNLDITIEKILSSMKIEFTDDELLEFEIRRGDNLTDANQDDVVSLIVANWKRITSSYKGQRDASAKYINQIIGDSKRVAVVDIGWHGSSVLLFKTFVEDIMGKKCEVKCLMAATASKNSDALISFVQRGDISIYMFSPIENRIALLQHKSRDINNVLMETFLTAPHPSISQVSMNSNEEIQFEFERAEVRNYKIIEYIQKGILDFIELYYRHFDKYDYMLNIKGHDAYTPVHHVLKDLSLIDLLFKDYVYNRTVGNDYIDRVETIGHLIDSWR